jgi:DNA-binding MarR family transcriptional regulator
MENFNADQLDDAIHGKVRLGVMAYLSGAGSVSFPMLKAALGASDGNLSVHLRKLEAAGHIEIAKSFNGVKPLTTIALTDQGREAWIKYLEQLQLLLDARLPKGG